jgi:hypothetical protein
MAQPNFGLLNTNLPAEIASSVQRGQDEALRSQMAQQQLKTGAMQQETSQLQLDQLKRDRDALAKMQQAFVANGKSPDLESNFDEMINSGIAHYVDIGVKGKQKILEQRQFANIMGMGEPPPARAVEPAPAVSSNRVNEFGAAPGVEVFKVNEQPAPINALAPSAPAASAAPVNALAMPPDVTSMRRKRDMLLAMGTTQSIAAARTMDAEIALASKDTSAPDAKLMQQLGYPLTPAGYQSFRDAQRQERMLNPTEEAQRIRIALASRPPAPPAQPSAPVAVVDPVTGKQVYVSREDALRGRMTPAAAMESLNPKEIQKREAAYPQATSIIKGIEDKASSFTKDLTELLNHPGLSSITGIAAGRLPGITAEGRAAQAIYDKIVAKGGFQALQEMRDANKTGGALGNVSNQEGTQLKASFAAIDRRQEADDVKKAIEQAIDDVERTKVRMREAYDSTYSYKSAAPAATQGTGGFKYLGKEGK